MRAWEPLLERMAVRRYPQLVAYAMRLTGSRPDAEDLVQEALVTTFSGRARFATEAEAEAYVRRAVASRFIDAGRRRTIERRALERHVGQTPVEHVPPPSVGLAPEVERALALLAPRERACVVLRHMEDLSTRETAQLLRLSEGAVKRYVSDAVAALTEALVAQPAGVGGAAGVAGPDATADIGKAMWGAVDAETKALDGLAPADDDLARLRGRVRRGRTVRHVREVAVALPVVAALVAAGWFGLDRLTGTAPPVTTPEPVEPTPSPTPTPEEDDVVLGAPIDEPDVPTYYAMPDGLLDTVGAGWVLATYAPRVVVDDVSPPSVELVFLVSPEGTRFLVARLDPGVTPDGGSVEWTEHELLSWQAGELVATLREVDHSDGDDWREEPVALQQLDLVTGQISSASGEPDWVDSGLSPDGTMTLTLPEGGDGTVVERVSDGATVAGLPLDSPAGWCEVMTWWTADSLLAACVDENPDTGDHIGPLVPLNPRLVVLPLDDLGSGAGTTLRALAAGDPWPVAWKSTYVSENVVAWEGTELAVDIDLSGSCPTGVYLQSGERIERLPASSDDRVELNLYEPRAVGGQVYVDATGGCSGDMRPNILTRYDVATGTTTELVPPPPRHVARDVVAPGPELVRDRPVALCRHEVRETAERRRPRVRRRARSLLPEGRAFRRARRPSTPPTPAARCSRWRRARTVKGCHRYPATTLHDVAGAVGTMWRGAVRRCSRGRTGAGGRSSLGSRGPARPARPSRTASRRRDASGSAA